MHALRTFVLASILLAPEGSVAETLTFSTSQSQFTSGVDNNGWWADNVGNNDENESYFVGTYSGSVYRNFFTFDLTALPVASSVVSATLRLSRWSSGPDNEMVETLEFLDVSTDPTTLNGGSDDPNAAVFADLGLGTSYGEFSIQGAGTWSDVLGFALDADALADIESAAGGFFSIGGVLNSQSGDDYLFAASGGGIQQLVVVIPEPATGTMLLTGLVVLRLRTASRAGRRQARRSTAHLG
ncbi:MAG TPA: hypothetical protein VII72_10310 [Myxococcota bacterium]|jgi:hypothetical protein